ncbi:MAG: oligopeptide/dipeptide ABC transporter ATP-binding protein, partial [Terriglobales bacterium]
EVGTTAQIFREPLHPYTQELVRIAKSAVGDPTFVVSALQHGRFAAIAGESPDPCCLPAGCRFHPRCPERMEICSERYPQSFLPEPSRPVNCFKYGE